MKKEYNKPTIEIIEIIEDIILTSDNVDVPFESLQ